MHKGNLNFILTIVKTFRSDRVQGTAFFVHMTSRGYKPVNPECNSCLCIVTETENWKFQNQIQGPRNINNNVLIEWAHQGLHFSCILTFSCWKTPQWYQDLLIDIILLDK